MMTSKKIRIWLAVIAIGIFLTQPSNAMLGQPADTPFHKEMRYNVGMLMFGGLSTISLVQTLGHCKNGLGSCIEALKEHLVRDTTIYKDENDSTQWLALPACRTKTLARRDGHIASAKGHFAKATQPALYCLFFAAMYFVCRDSRNSLKGL